MDDMQLQLKVSGLKVLVDNNILTEEEYDKCVHALKDESNDVLPIVTAVTARTSLCNEYVYEDSKISLKFKGIQRITNLFYGEGYAIRFVLENKSPYKLRVSLTDVSSNGFVIEDDGLLVKEALPFKKSVDSVNVFDGKLRDCDIYDVNDFGTIELRVKYEIEELGNYEFESELFEVETYEV